MGPFGSLGRIGSSLRLSPHADSNLGMEVPHAGGAPSEAWCGAKGTLSHRTDGFDSGWVCSWQKGKAALSSQVQILRSCRLVHLFRRMLADESKRLGLVEGSTSAHLGDRLLQDGFVRQEMETARFAFRFGSFEVDATPAWHGALTRHPTPLVPRTFCLRPQSGFQTRSRFSARKSRCNWRRS